MSYYVFRGHDRPGAGDVRARERQRHREHLQSAAFGVRVVAGGMIMSDDGGRVTGSLLVLRCATREAAEHFIEHDPYHAAGVFLRTAIDRWDWAIGAPAD